jgi:hypothetical protein
MDCQPRDLPRLLFQHVGLSSGSPFHHFVLNSSIEIDSDSLDQSTLMSNHSVRARNFFRRRCDVLLNGWARSFANCICAKPHRDQDNCSRQTDS